MLLAFKPLASPACSRHSCRARRHVVGPSGDTLGLLRVSKQKPGLAHFQPNGEGPVDEAQAKRALLLAISEQVGNLERQYESDKRTAELYIQEQKKRKEARLRYGKGLILETASQVTEAVDYADELVARGRGQEPTTAMPGQDPQTVEELSTLLQGTQLGSVLQDVFGYDSVEDSCANLIDLVEFGDHPSNLDFLDWAVDSALVFGTPSMEAEGPNVARAIRLLRDYKTKVRPLLVAALFGDEQGSAECALGLQAVRNEYLGGARSDDTDEV